MLFHKCCPFLMRTMSPQVVGLILFCIIGALSEITPTHESHPHQSKLSPTSTPFARPCSSFWMHCNKEKHSSFGRRSSKDNALTVPEVNRTSDNRTHSFIRHNSSPLLIVDNINKRNVTHAVFRRPSRRARKIFGKRMKEASKRTGDVQQPNKIPRNSKIALKTSTSSRRRLNPRTVSSLEHLLNSLIRNKNYRITLSVDAAKPDNYFVKLFENLPNYRNLSNEQNLNSARGSVSTSDIKSRNRTSIRRPYLPNISNFHSKRNLIATTENQAVNDLKSVNEPRLQIPSSEFAEESFNRNVRIRDFTRKPKIKPSNGSNEPIQNLKDDFQIPKSGTARKNVFVTPDSSNELSNEVTSSTSSAYEDDQPRKFRRSGRNFDITDSSEHNNKSKASHSSVIGALFSNITILNRLTNKAKTVNDLFNYTYQISAVERGSLFPHDPFPDTSKEFGKRSSFISPYVSPDVDKQSVPDRVSDPRNTSVYNSLRPRLRTTKSPFAKTTFGQRAIPSPEPTSQVPKRSTTPKTRFKMKLLLRDSDAVTLTTVNVNPTDSPVADHNNTDGLKFDSSILLPKRINSNFTRGFVTELQNRTRNSPRFPSSRKVLKTATVNDNVPLREVVRENNSTEPLTKIYRYSVGRSRQFNSPSNRSIAVMPKLTPNSTGEKFTEIYDSTSPDIREVTSTPTVISGTLLHRIDETFGKLNSSTDTGGSSPDVPVSVTEYLETDHIRQPKMTDTENVENVAIKKPRLDPKTFYDYLMKSSMGNASYNFTVPEFRPGNFFRYDGIYPRKPVMDMAYSRPTPFFKVRTTTKAPVTEQPPTPTTFESMRTSIRVSSTFYPNRMQDITMRFGNLPESPATLPTPGVKEGESDESELRDAVEPGFTMERLAYLLIGTCCGLSILCLCVVVIAIKCRRALVDKRIKAQFRRRLYQHDRLKDSPWQQQMFDHFMYLHGQPDSSSRSSANSCSCHCVTWSLGARNLESTRPLCSNNSRSSLYLCGQKKLPFGAASTLRFESMLGRKSSPSPGQAGRHESHTNSSSSQENDSLEQDSDSRASTTSRHCTCINYTMWPMPGNVRRGMYGLCPTAGHYVAGDCSHHSPEDIGAMPRNCPPPVTGSNYLDRSEGVVYWSSNDERLI